MASGVAMTLTRVAGTNGPILVDLTLVASPLGADSWCKQTIKEP
jgi:hypothetical protein